MKIAVKCRRFIIFILVMESKKIIFISEEEKRKRALLRTPTERFDLLMRLIRIGKMLEEARKSKIEGKQNG